MTAIVPFLYILSFLDKALLEKPMLVAASTGRIVLHLKSAIWYSSATRFGDLQGGMKTLDDEHHSFANPLGNGPNGSYATLGAIGSLHELCCSEIGCIQ